MHRLVYILVVMVVAGAVGCRRSASDIEQRLIDIDSLIADSPDSALTLLGEISATSDELQATSSEPSENSESSENSENSEENSPSKIEGVPAWWGRMTDGEGTLRGGMTPGERGYHALLTAQAMYKAYIPATSDSIINVAWDYYKDLGLLASAADRRRRVRTMLYKGTTAEELGHPDSAMRWYKRTELEAAPDDHYIKGYSLMRQASLFQTQHTTDSADLVGYKLALPHFIALNDTNYQLVCLTEIGGLYRTQNMDSADYYISKALSLSKNYKDKFFYYTNLVVSAGRYLLVNKYREAADNCIQVLTDNYNDYNSPELCKIYLAHAYANLNEIDSAIYYLPRELKNANPGTKVFYYKTKSLISQFSGDTLNFYRNDNIQLHIADSVMFDSLKTEIHNVNITFDRIKAKNERETLLFYIIVLILTVTLLIIILSLVITRKKYTISQLQSHLINLKAELESNEERSSILENELSEEHDKHTIRQKQLSDLSDQITSLKNDNENHRIAYNELSGIIVENISILQEIADFIEQFGTKPELFFKKTKLLFSSLKPDKLFWQKMETYANIHYDDVANKIFNTYPNLKDEDRHLIILMIFGMTNKAIMSFTYLSSEEAVKTRAYRVKQKMALNVPLRQYIEQLKTGYNQH